MKNQQPKSVLLTNYNMINYTGSEIDTLTMANYFLDQGYKVSIFTLDSGFPLIDKISNKIQLIDYKDSHLLDSHYDLIWSHHFPLLDYLLFSKKIEADYINYSSLSAYEPYECFPFYYKELNHLTILSQEAFDLAKSEGYDTKKIHIFTNYSPQKYFKRDVKISQKLKNICIVSNHIPTEILELSEILLENNYHIDIYGSGYNYTEVDDDLLVKYDLIISIGKTINYGLSLGIPCYCYDRFGGDGYINQGNIKNSFKYNFSGRYSGIKMTGQELFDDITVNYNNTLKECNQLRNWSFNNFCYEENMSKTLKQIYATKKFSQKNLLKKYPTEERRSLLLVREVGTKNIIIKDLSRKLVNNHSTCKFYYDIGNGFNEEDSEVLEYYQIPNSHIYCVEYKLPTNIQNLRFDYTDKSLIKLNSLKINNELISNLELTNNIKIDNDFISVNDDPSIILPITDKKLKIEVNMEPVSLETIFDNLTFQEDFLQNKIKPQNKNLLRKIIFKKFH